ncbi:MAG TPA: hypothetical protein VLU25_12285 [Acidobacteriota bacterium]|nr:hypothetical protein [Acidobacteriota bacterium]
MRLTSQLIVLTSFLLIACDPGFSFDPDDWDSHHQDGYDWKKQIDKIEIAVASMGGVIGDSYVGLSLQLSNQGDELLILEKSELITGGKREFEASLPGSGDMRWRSVEANRSERLELSWYFGRSAIDVLGERFKVLLHLRRGEQVQPVEIHYSRVK